MSDIENPPAFPRDHRHIGHNGMTLRDWFAGQALVGLMANSVHDHCPLFGDGLPFARDAYAVADAMLAERSKPAKADPEPKMQHVAYFDEGQFHWMSGIAPHDCELFAKEVSQ
jgi:hypothetical protein